jgi:hypothetical protein
MIMYQYIEMHAIAGLSHVSTSVIAKVLLKTAWRSGASGRTSAQQALSRESVQKSPPGPG